MMVGVLMRAGTLLTQSLRSAHQASGDAGDCAAPAGDEANCEGLELKSGGGGKPTVAGVNGGSQDTSPLFKVCLLRFPVPRTGLPFRAVIIYS
jgi:hypothetical protein